MAQKIKNIESIIAPLKSKLKQYLTDNGTEFKGTLFTCPNHKQHAHNDRTPACGFIPNTDDEVFHCFGCNASGDLFTAYHYLEDKAILGKAFPEAVQELAKRYSVPFELVPFTKQEEELHIVHNFINQLITVANKYLKSGKNEQVLDYLKTRKWDTVIDQFQFGYLPNLPEIVSVFTSQYAKYTFLEDYIKIPPTQIIERLIFPIKDPYGNIIGINDRKVHESDTRPKYQKYFLKTLERGEVLFNAQTVHPEVYLVEGASSVFTMQANGINNAVAVLGCAFTENMYKSLVKNGVKKAIISFDGDTPGQEAMLRAIEHFEKHPDIKLYVKILKDGLDPDDFIQRNGINEYKQVTEDSAFKFQLNRYKTSLDDIKKDEYKKSLFNILVHTKDSISANEMMDLMCKELNINKKLITSEMQKYEVQENIVNDIGVSAIVAEEDQLLDNIEAFEERALRAGKLLGMSTGFPLLDSKIDGVQEGLILISGKWNVGKSALQQSIALNMMRDPNCYVLYFSIDDSVVGKTIPRLLANLSGLPINTVANPINEIENNELLHQSERDKLKIRRDMAIVDLKKFKGRLGIKDSADGHDTKYVEKVIKTYRAIAGDKKLVVFVDFLNMVITNDSMERTEQETRLAGFFKLMSTKYNCPVICTVESTKGVLDAKTSESSIKGSASLQFRSDLTILLYSSWGIQDDSKMFFWDSKGVAQPIVKLRISKNKMGPWKGDLYYKFYKECSKFEECSEVDTIDFVKRFAE